MRPIVRAIVWFERGMLAVETDSLALVGSMVGSGTAASICAVSRFTGSSSLAVSAIGLAERTGRLIEGASGARARGTSPSWLADGAKFDAPEIGKFGSAFGRAILLDGRGCSGTSAILADHPAMAPRTATPRIGNARAAASEFQSMEFASDRPNASRSILSSCRGNSCRIGFDWGSGVGVGPACRSTEESDTGRSAWAWATCGSGSTGLLRRSTRAEAAVG